MLEVREPASLPAPKVDPELVALDPKLTPKLKISLRPKLIDPAAGLRLTEVARSNLVLFRLEVEAEARATATATA